MENSGTGINKQEDPQFSPLAGIRQFSLSGMKFGMLVDIGRA
jgi:hypothetical protein